MSKSSTDRRATWAHGLTGEGAAGRGPVTEQTLHLRDGDSTRPVCNCVPKLTNVGYERLTDRQQGHQPDEAWPPVCASCLRRSTDMEIPSNGGDS